MTCQVILEFKAKKDAIDGIRSFLREILPDTRGYDGCVGLNAGIPRITGSSRKSSMQLIY